MEIITYISKKYDLGKFNRACNCKECHKFPSKEVLIIEHDKKNNKSREIASLFFCNTHFRKEHRELKDELKKFVVPMKMFELKVFEIGYVTY